MQMKLECFWFWGDARAKEELQLKWRLLHLTFIKYHTRINVLVIRTSHLKLLKPIGVESGGSRKNIAKLSGIDRRIKTYSIFI